MSSIVLEDRRSFNRVPYNTTVGYRKSSKIGKGFIRDISPAGMLMFTNDMFNVGEIINIDFQFRHGKYKMNLQGKVARIEPDGIGITFMWSR